MLKQIWFWKIKETWEKKDQLLEMKTFDLDPSFQKLEVLIGPHLHTGTAYRKIISLL